MKKELAEAEVAVATLLAWCGYLEQAVEHNNRARAAALANVVVVRAQKLEAAEATARAKAWRQALSKQKPGASDSGHGDRLSRLAFRWVKGVSGWTSGTTDVDGYDTAVPDYSPGCKRADGEITITPPSDPDGAHSGPASDQAQVEATARTWAKLWKAEAAYLQPDLSEADNEILPPLTGSAIKLATSSFPGATGVGADALAPRAIAKLPDQLLDELAALLTLAEDTGD